MKKISGLLFLLIFVYSCRTDFDVAGQWKDITVVYGILNQNDSVHYIKVNKAFLGDQDAFVMAQNPDSLNYKDLTVKLEGWNTNNTKIQEITLDTFTIANKEPGIFAGPGQLLYKTNATLNQALLYKLIITNNISGKVFTSQTRIVYNFAFTNPTPSPTSKITFASNMGIYSNSVARWTAPSGGRQYQLTVKINYIEINTQTSDTAYKHLDWVYSPENSVNSDGGTTVAVLVKGDEFYRFLASHLNPDPKYKRLVINDGVRPPSPTLDFIIDVAGEDLTTYMEINKPSTGLVQEKPVYTNIEGGLGIFSSRNRRILPDKELTPISIAELKSGAITGNLNFRE